MKKSKRRPFRSVIFVLFAVLIGAFLILPVSALLMAKQDVADAPASVEFANQQFFPSVPVSPFADVPFPQVDPMQSFVDKIRDAKDEDAKQEAIDQAKAALEKHYDKYIDAYEQQVDEMESRMRKLRDQLDKRKEVKNRLVGLKLEMITSQADGIGWPDATDRPNTPRFPGPTMWRTKPRFFSPAAPSAVREIPVPLFAAKPADVYFRAAAPQSTAQSPRRGAAVGPLANTPPIAFTPPVASSGNLETAVFDTFFETGIQLLEERKYGEFLDRYLPPNEFRKNLRSATLDEVSKKFGEESAESILLQFRLAAMKKPVRTYNPKTETLTWEPIKVDGEKKELTLVRQGDQWYLSLQGADQDNRQTQ